MKTDKPNKGGRPPKDASKKKNVHLDMRLEEVEKEAFRAAAELAGLDLSAWIRERLRSAARAELEGAGQSVPFLPGQNGK
jgi:hypothetical protein